MKHQTLGYVLLAFTAFLASANSAETVVNGISVRSKVVTNEFPCDGYNILVKEDKYPVEFEEALETRPKRVLPGFRGNALTVGAKAYVMKNGIEYRIPDVTKRYQLSGKLLNDGRVYLPALGYCIDKNTFVMSVWSGGNCTQCELLIRYQIDQIGKVVKVGSPSEKEWEEIMSKGIPNPKIY